MVGNQTPTLLRCGHDRSAPCNLRGGICLPIRRARPGRLFMSTRRLPCGHVPTTGASCFLLIATLLIQSRDPDLASMAHHFYFIYYKELTVVASLVI
ncbi:hypothetical protein PAHAL_7G318400 [Panicum hallii]|uniref:Uncharacterized protein n=1 Tax=Panicum hallii TaxID=206008 RepID=A0A2S3IB28_9POAL|nr:hypothetical protein PAHAL_7G318400 [Panicum hallii]